MGRGCDRYRHVCAYTLIDVAREGIRGGGMVVGRPGMVAVGSGRGTGGGVNTGRFGKILFLTGSRHFI